MWIDEAFLLCLADLVCRADMADQERRRRIVQFHGLQDSVVVGIGISVAAQVAAGIVGADIAGDVAGAFFAVSLNRW